MFLSKFKLKVAAAFIILAMFIIPAALMFANNTMRRIARGSVVLVKDIVKDIVAAVVWCVEIVAQMSEYVVNAVPWMISKYGIVVVCLGPLSWLYALFVLTRVAPSNGYKRVVIHFTGVIALLFAVLVILFLHVWSRCYECANAVHPRWESCDWTNHRLYGM